MPVLNPAITGELDASVAPAKMVSHLAALAADIETLLALLQDGEGPTTSAALEAVTHKVAGDAGQLGFVALSAAARRYETAWHANGTQRPGQASARRALAAALRDTAGTTLVALRQRHDLMRRTAMPLAGPP